MNSRPVDNAGTLHAGSLGPLVKARAFGMTQVRCELHTQAETRVAWAPVPWKTEARNCKIGRIVMTNDAEGEPSKCDMARLLYEQCQQSAEHHDTLLWEVTYIVWGSTMLLLGFVLEAIKEQPLLCLITAILSVIVTIMAWWFTKCFAEIRNYMTSAKRSGIPRDGVETARRSGRPLSQGPPEEVVHGRNDSFCPRLAVCCCKKYLLVYCCRWYLPALRAQVTPYAVVGRTARIPTIP
jgi:hypothetical protein